jgi:cleavage and polyadenylation specificity factor subunit 2
MTLQQPTRSVSVTCTPLVGSQGTERAYVLCIEDGHEDGGVTLLLDCGWTAPYLVSELENRYSNVEADSEGLYYSRDDQKKLRSKIGGILVSHPDQEHMGGLAYMLHRKGWSDCKVPVFVSGAAHKMGQMVLYDAYLNSTDDIPFDLDDIDAAFRGMLQLRYRQETVVCQDRVTVTPYPSGRVVGGSIWKIHVHGNDVLYAVDYNHRREIHLMGGSMMDPSSMLSAASVRPALLITDAYTVDKVSGPVQYAKNEQALIDTCLSCLRAEGNVLIPVDAAGRLLEILLVLNKYWKEKNLTYPLAVVGPMIHTTLEFARSQLEWMNEDLVKSLGHSRIENPLSLTSVTPCATIKDLRKLPRGPKVVLATSDSMDVGASRTLFSWWAGQANSAIVLALEPKDGTFAQKIFAQKTKRYPANPLVRMTLSKRVPLQGEELEAYKALQKQKAVADQVLGQEQADVASHVSEKRVFEDRKGAHLYQAPTRSNVAVIGHATRDGADLAHEDALMINGDGIGLDQDDNPCLIEGFEVAVGLATSMFPEENELELIEYDEYGSMIDLDEMGTDKGEAGDALVRALASEAAAERYAAEGVEELGDDIMEPEVPTKVETQELSVQLAARVIRLDFDGRSDGASVETLLSKMAPRSCIIINGTKEARSKIASNLMKDLEGLNSHVFVPNDGEEIMINLGPIRPAVLSDTLFKSIQMRPVADSLELGWLDSTGHVESGDTLFLQQRGQSQADARYGGVFIGDVKLSQLKRALARENIVSEFYEGGLYCAGNILVKRQAEGGLILEGSLSDEYFKIRQILYSQYHVC